MSTRGFLGWKIDGKIVTTYNHSDSYPSWLGREIAEDLRTVQADVIASLGPEFSALAPADQHTLVRAGLRERFARVELVDDETPLTDEQKARLTEAGAHNSGVSRGDDTYAWTRNLHGSITAILAVNIANKADESWPADSCFCEWGYLLNFDADGGLGWLEVYKGFQKSSPTAGEWAGAEAPLEPTGKWVAGKWIQTGEAPSEFFPVNLVKWYSLVPPPAPEQLVSLEQELANALVGK
jgi:hypothetical protein